MADKGKRRWIWLLLLLLAAFVVGWAARPIPPQKYTEEEIKALRDELEKAKLEPVTIVREIEKIVPGPVRTRTVYVSDGRVDRGPAEVARTPSDPGNPPREGPAVPPEGQPGGVVGGMHDCLDPAALTVDLAGGCKTEIVEANAQLWARSLWDAEAWVLDGDLLIAQAHRGPEAVAMQRLEAIRGLQVRDRLPGQLSVGLGITSAPGAALWGSWWRRGRRIGIWGGVEYDLDPDSLYLPSQERVTEADRWQVSAGLALRLGRK